MVKTYKREPDGTLLYREVWTDGPGVWRHEGKVGTKGKSSYEFARSKAFPDRGTPTQLVREYVADAESMGYAEIPDDALGWVVLQIRTRTANLSDPADRRVWDEGEDALTNFVGWRGVGHCDGYDVGGTAPDGVGTILNLFCRVVDTTAGVKVVRAFVREFGLEQDWVIGVREPGDESPYLLGFSPRRGEKEFSL